MRSKCDCWRILVHFRVCEAFVFFPSVDFYSRPREMRSGELPRLRPPRVESWRARRGGLEGAGKNWGGDLAAHSCAQTQYWW